MSPSRLIRKNSFSAKADDDPLRGREAELERAAADLDRPLQRPRGRSEEFRRDVIAEVPGKGEAGFPVVEFGERPDDHFPGERIFVEAGGLEPYGQVGQHRVDVWGLLQMQKNSHFNHNFAHA